VLRVLLLLINLGLAGLFVFALGSDVWELYLLLLLIVTAINIWLFVKKPKA
jgi:hypothetical protein